MEEAIPHHEGSQARKQHRCLSGPNGLNSELLTPNCFEIVTSLCKNLDYDLGSAHLCITCDILLWRIVCPRIPRHHHLDPLLCSFNFLSTFNDYQDYWTALMIYQQEPQILWAFSFPGISFPTARFPTNGYIFLENFLRRQNVQSRINIPSLLDSSRVHP